MFDIRIGYPTLEEEEKILSSTTRGETVELNKVLSGKAIVNLQKLVSSVPVSDYTVKYVAKLVRATRPGDVLSPQFVKDLVDFGAGPRAGQNLIRAGKAMAAMDGRFSVSSTISERSRIFAPAPDQHQFPAQAEGQSTETLIKRPSARSRSRTSRNTTGRKRSRCGTRDQVNQLAAADPRTQMTPSQ